MDVCGSQTRPLQRGPGDVRGTSGRVPREQAPSPGPLPPQRSIHSWLPHPRVVTDARAMARKVLELYEVEIVDDVEVVVSELITNALKASRSDWPVTLRLLIDSEAVLVAVADESDELPEIRDVGFDETAGRGLLIVESLSHGDCGYTLGAYGGKTVWALIARTS